MELKHDYKTKIKDWTSGGHSFIIEIDSRLGIPRLYFRLIPDDGVYISSFVGYDIPDLPIFRGAKVSRTGYAGIQSYGFSESNMPKLAPGDLPEVVAALDKGLNQESRRQRDFYKNRTPD